MEKEEEEDRTENKPPNTTHNSNQASFVKVASIQFASRMGEVDYNRLKLGTLCEEAAKNGAKIIVLPETSITGYLSQDILTNWRVKEKPMSPAFKHSMDPTNYAESQNGPSVQFFRELSGRLKVYITVPFLEIQNDNNEDKFYNSVSLVSPAGTVVAHYRKNNPWPHPEKSWATAGSSLATYNTEYGKVGIAVCFDIHHVLAKYANEEIWTLLYPIAWVGNVTEWFRTELPIYLNKWRVPFNIIGANWSVDTYDPSWRGFGYSTIYGPAGTLLAATGNYEGSDIIYAQIPLNNHKLYKMDTNAYSKYASF